MTNGDCLLRNVKGSNMALPGTEDMGFCSSEDYLENDIHSPTDTSEDSVEVKVSPISLVSKRKRVEPRLAIETFKGPFKKRMCMKVKAEIESHPFRPWSPKPESTLRVNKVATEANVVNINVSDIKVKTEQCSAPLQKNMCQTIEEPQYAYFRPPSPVNYYLQTEPVPLIKKRDNTCNIKTETESNQDIRVPIHPQIQSLSTAETERMILKTNELFPPLQHSSPSGPSSSSSKSQETQRREQRNYKNMTRERRIEANARERTRVHTISAAFDTLRRSIPAYSHNQKLSKLSVLRIACSYIMTLSSICNEDDPPNDEPSTSECVDMVSRTIQREGKIRKKKDDND